MPRTRRMNALHKDSGKGTSPRSVIRGESPLSLPVLVDYLSFTVPNGRADEILIEVCLVLGSTAEERGRGIFGYTRSYDVGGFAIVACGGDAQRGTVLVSINGAGCARVADFARVRAWAESLGARVTRVDVAADDKDGEALDVQRGLQAWRDGAFKTRGRPPKARVVDDCGSGDGCTLYIGTREGGKLARIYEKGKALGDAASRWVRAEVELHAKDRVIPWEIVTDPVRFLAGSFPFFAPLSLYAERITTIARGASVSLTAAARWVRMAAGRTLNVLLREAGGDLGVLLELRREGVPRRLKAWFDSGGAALAGAGSLDVEI